MDVKLYVDEDGVVHWRYVMRGTLTLCGFRAPRLRDDAYPSCPSCLRCIVLKDTHDEKTPAQ